MAAGEAPGQARFTIAAGHPVFAGHFPGHPIVPAVMLLAEALDAVAHSSGVPVDAWIVSSAKFIAPVGPDTTLVVAHSPTASGNRRFEIRTGDGAPVASGTLDRRAGRSDDGG
ncbi:MAG TPA: hypothetical protein VEC19_16405 [Usitatibacter sp.]|nr:hypothetical protein [Usitatibacter sp.]